MNIDDLLRDLFPDPDDEKEVTWEWDAESLELGEFVGFPLYLSLRDRLCTIKVPDVLHNALIEKLIHAYDDCALTAGLAQCTLIYDRSGTHIVGLEIVDGTKMDKNFNRIE